MSSSINILLNHSEQMDSLTAAHLSEFSVLLEDKKQLRTALADAQTELEQKDEIISEQRETIQQLRKRIAELEKRPTITTNTYIEKNVVENMHLGYQKRKTRKLSTETYFQQLPLWTTTEPSM